jgi:heme-degrading monooxygenase HmoA
MILEHAILDVRPGRGTEFEGAFDQAKTVISGATGCRSVRLQRCLEVPNRYLLLVEWEHLEDHTEGFRTSAAFEEWRGLLHPFYDPFPTVEHFEVVVDLPG